MREVTVKTSDLLERIKTNRDEHRTIFEEAVIGYRKAAIEELDKALKDAKDGRRIWRRTTLVQPEDHTPEYDRVIDMLEMSVDEDITLDAASFACYMRDEWVWQRQFLTSNSAYSATAGGKFAQTYTDDNDF